MRDSRSVTPAESAAASFAPADSVSDGGRSAVRMLAAATEVGGPRVVTGSGPAPAASRAPVGRIDLARLTAVPPLHRPTVTGGGAGRAGNHVGGAMLPPVANTVALSDGTRITFGAVTEIPVFESA